jgi:thiol-disulfide isomerase/thioredoxin
MTQTNENAPKRKSRPRRALMIALPLAGAALVAFTLASRNTEAVAQECVASQDITMDLAPLARGEVAAVAVHPHPRLPPDIAFTGPDGEPVTLADFGDKTVLLNIWATWCAPCREEMPALDELQARYGSENFEVVAVNVDTRNLDRPRAWLEEHGIDNLAYYAEHDGRLLQVLQRSGHVVGLPTTVLFGENNCELAILKGPAHWSSEDAFAFIRTALRL